MIELTADLRIRRFILAGIMLMVCISIMLSGVGGISAEVRNSGTASCTVALNGSTCTTATITFANPYSSNPTIAAFETLSPTFPFHTTAIPGSTIANLITFQTPGNTTILAHDDETPVTVTIPNVDTSVKAWDPQCPANAFCNSNPFPTMIVESEGYITTGALSVKQVISIMIENVACVMVPLIFQTVQFEAQSITAAGKTPFSIKATMPNDGLGPGELCAAVNVVAPIADANTMITVNSLRVYGQQSGFQVWANMPSTSFNPIYGNMNLQQEFRFQAGTPTLQFCVNVFGLSGNSTAFLTPAISGVEISSGLRLVVGGATGLQCNSASVTLTACPAGCSVNVYGGFGDNAEDMPAFGAISMTWNQTVTGFSLNLAVGYSPPIILAETATSFQLKIQFTQTISAANTITFTWSSI
jgi:hypothetical protein